MSNEKPEGKLTEVELLRYKNLHLTALKLSSDRSALLIQIQYLERDFQEAQKKAEAYKQELREKYGVDWSRYTVNDDTGEFIDHPGLQLRTK